MEAEDPWKSHKINGKRRNENKSAICSLGMGTKQSGWLNRKTRSSCRSKGIIKITTSHSYSKLFSSSYFYSPHTQPPEGQPKHLFPGNPLSPFSKVNFGAGGGGWNVKPAKSIDVNYQAPPYLYQNQQTNTHAPTNTYLQVELVSSSPLPLTLFCLMCRDKYIERQNYVYKSSSPPTVTVHLSVYLSPMIMAAQSRLLIRKHAPGGSPFMCRMNWNCMPNGPFIRSIWWAAGPASIRIRWIQCRVARREWDRFDNLKAQRSSGKLKRFLPLLLLLLLCCCCWCFPRGFA